MSFLATLLSSLFGAILKGVASFFAGKAQRREDQAAGVSAQAAKETASSLATERLVAKAEADVDRSQSGIADAADQGKF